MPRALFITQTAHPIGGVETWLDGLVPALTARGWEVVVGLVRGRRFHDPDRYRAAHRHPNTIEVPALTGTEEGRIRAVTRAVRMVQPDVVVPVSIITVLEAMRRLRARGEAAHMFFPIHSLHPETYLDLRDYAGTIDLAVATNRLARIAAERIGGIAAGRARYAPCGVPPPLAPPAFGATSVLRLLFVGRLMQPAKRALDLIPLCAELDRRSIDYQLEIVGSGEEEATLRAALGDSKRVRFLGMLSRDELYASIYPQAAAIVITSESETGPIVAWEAMRHGAAVVTAAYRGVRAEGSLRDGETAVVVPVGDMRAMADRIAWLAFDPAALDRLRRAAWRLAEKRYTLERSNELWVDAFESCLRLDRQPAHGRDVAMRKQGRLDRLLGVTLAESVRGVAGRGMLHGNAGGEWPHSAHTNDPACVAIDAEIAAMDRPE